MLSKDDVMFRAKLWNEVTDYIRAFFRSRDYTEVQTPIVVRSPGMEPNLSPIGVDVRLATAERAISATDGTSFLVGEWKQQTVHAALITSPEYAMKKLLGLGAERIFTVTPVFRNGEYLGGEHSIEFTMLEWYRQHADYNACMDETEALINGLMGWTEQWPRVSYVDAFTQTFGVHPADLRDVNQLQEILHDWNKGARSDDLAEAIGFAFQTLVLPGIMRDHDKFFLTEFPVAEASLAQKTADGRAAQRFEAYVNRVELCNGFTELVDPEEQRARFLLEQEERRKAGKEVFPIDEELLSRLSSVASPTFGNALGVDRLVMLKAGINDIDSIHLFPPTERFK